MPDISTCVAGKDTIATVTAHSTTVMVNDTMPTGNDTKA